MAYFNSHRWHALALVGGLGLWTLAPYGGCSCDNPLNDSSPARARQVYGGLEAEQALKTGKPLPANLVDDFNDGVGSKSQIGSYENFYVNGGLTQVYFNGNNPQYRTNLWGGGTYAQADAFQTSQYASSLSQAYAASNPVPSSESACLEFGCSACQMGHVILQDPPDIENPAACVANSVASCGAFYPFVEHGMYLTPQNAGGEANVEFNGGVADPGMSAGALAGHGLEFSLVNPSGVNVLTVKLILLYLYNYSQTAPCTNSDSYEYHLATVNVIPAGGQVQIPFSSFKLGYPAGYTQDGNKIGTNLVKGTSDSLDDPAAWVDGYGNYTGDLQIMAIQFDPTDPANPSGTCPNEGFPSEGYNFYIDNVEFY